MELGNVNIGDREPPDHFNAHPAVMVRALPGLNYRATGNGRKISVQLPEPFRTLSVIGQLLLYELPDIERSRKELVIRVRGIAFELLRSVHEAEHRFSLNPPDPVSIVDALLALVQQRMVYIGSLINALCQRLRDRRDPFGEIRIVERLETAVDQPRSLDIVSV